MTNKSTRVYWHGTFPDFTRQGVVTERSGDLRTPVLWDGASEPSLEWNGAIKPVTAHATCKCGRCGGSNEETP